MERRLSSGSRTDMCVEKTVGLVEMLSLFDCYLTEENEGNCK